MTLAILVTLLLPPLFPSFLLPGFCSIFLFWACKRASVRCNLVTFHWAARIPGGPCPSPGSRTHSVAAAPEGISISGSHGSLLIHPEPPSTQVFRFFFTSFFSSTSSPLGLLQMVFGT